MAFDVLANLELMFFKPKNIIFTYFENIKKKYEKNFPKLFKYIEKNFFNTYPYKDLDWAYDIKYSGYKFFFFY